MKKNKKEFKPMIYSCSGLLKILEGAYKIKINFQRLHQFRTGSGRYQKLLTENVDFLQLENSKIVYYGSCIDKIVNYYRNK